MARLNIEDCWWTDLRRSKLIKLLGCDDKADVAAIRMWRVAQDFWGNDRSLIPFRIWDSLEAGPKLIEAGLAFAEADGVYVCGSSQYLDWLADKRAAAKKGGLNSANSRKKKTGTSQPKPKTPKQTRSTTEANSKLPEPSCSGSYSGSGSNSGTCSSSDLENITTGVQEPPVVKPKNPITQVRDAFLESFQKELKRPYPGWGAKENKMVQRWLTSVSLELAVELCWLYPKWDAKWVTERGHPFGILVTEYVQLDGWSKSHKIMIEKIARGKAVEAVELKNAIEKETNRHAFDAFRSERAKPLQHNSGNGGQISSITAQRIPHEPSGSHEPELFRKTGSNDF